MVAVEGGFHVLCSRPCRDRLRSSIAEALRTHVAEPRPGALRSGTRTDPVLRSIRKRRAARASITASAPEWTASHPAVPEHAPPLPTLALTIAGVGALAGVFASGWTLVGLSVLMVTSAAVLSLVGATPLRRDVGWLAWAMAPMGSVVSAVAAVVGHASGLDARFALVGASAAAACGVLRGWLDASAARPVERLFANARAGLPATARVPVDDAARPLSPGSREVESTALRAGEDVLVADGDTIPVDGIVRSGEAQVLLHPLARAPVRRRSGDPVLAGARVVQGGLRVLAGRVGDERALVRPAQFGDGSADDAARVTRLVARGVQFSGVAAVVASALGLVLGESGGGMAMRLSSAAAVLIAIPLLALRRASEAPFVAAGATAALRGIVFQSARALDRAGRVNVAVLCTHGTVTEGAPEVVEVHLVGGTRDETALGLAAGAEAGNEHPIADAVRRHVARVGVAPAAVRRVQSIPGRGLTAVGAAGESVVVGSRQLLLEEGVSVAALDLEAERAEQRGLSVVFVGVDRRVRALLTFRDEDRPGARAAVQRLMDLEIEAILMSGDHRGTVESLARTLDVAHVKAELPPEQRAAEVRRLRDAGSTIAVVGRPGHDDHALGAADVPVALGAAGVDRAVALTSDDVRDAADALWLASATRREAHRGVALAAGAGALLVALAANGFLPPGAVAILALAVDAVALPASARLLRRIDLRMPARG